VESIDLPFMAEVIQSLIGPIRWLANSDFRPEWNPGQKP
jgi:aminopeptidase YwaD